MKVHLASFAAFTRGSTKSVAIGEDEAFGGKRLKRQSHVDTGVPTSSLVDLRRLLAPSEGSTS